MSIKLGNYSFDGPYTTQVNIREEPAIYVLLRYTDDDFEILKMGQTTQAQRDNITRAVQIEFYLTDEIERSCNQAI